MPAIEFAMPWVPHTRGYFCAKDDFQSFPYFPHFFHITLGCWRWVGLEWSGKLTSLNPVLRNWCPPLNGNKLVAHPPYWKKSKWFCFGYIPLCAQYVHVTSPVDFPRKKGHPDKNHVTSARIEAFILICTALVQLMTPGLAFFYGGLVKDTSAAWQNWIDLLDWAGWLQVPVRPCGQFFSITGNGLNFEILKHITRWSDFCHERGWGYVYTAPSSEQKSGDLYN